LLVVQAARVEDLVVVEQAVSQDLAVAVVEVDTPDFSLVQFLKIMQ
jgi:hypothetical protein|tara:strand:+ start:267 stop:404 length:138 start_codon:yes stop_codon:yes gene_type:complete